MRPDIEAYLNGELHGEALERFEAELARDPALREEVELMRPTLRDLRRAGIARRVEAAGRNRAARRRVRRVVVLSCSVLLGLGGIWWLWQRGQLGPDSLPAPPDNYQKDNPLPDIDTPVQQQADLPPSPENGGSNKKDKEQKISNERQLFAAWFKPYKHESLEPSYRSKDEPSALERFQMLYWEDKHREALIAFDNLDSFDKNNDNLLFLKANCLLATGRADEAAALLENIVRNNRSRFAAEAKWYLALSYLNLGQTNAARSILETISTADNSPRQADAAQLLQQWK